MRDVATQDINKNRRVKLDEFFARIWRDGTFLHWVNPRTQKLHVGHVTKTVLGITDTSIFSGWAQVYRDRFNERYREWCLTNGTLPTSCDSTWQYTQAISDDPTDAFLEVFVKSQLRMGLSELDEDGLRNILNTYQAQSCQRFLVQLDDLKKRVIELERQVNKKDKKIAMQAEQIALNETSRVAEERHFMGSIRNMYSYEAGTDS